MERIGLAASRIAKGNLRIYNFFVVLIASLFSLLIFVISGVSITMGVILIALIIDPVAGSIFGERTLFLIASSLNTLAIVIVLFNIFAIGKNVKFKKES